MDQKDKDKKIKDHLKDTQKDLENLCLRDFILNEEGMYSITKPYESLQIAKLMSKIVKDLSSKTLTDGTACMGGDCIRLSRYFKHVNAFEINKENYDLLVKNCKNFGSMNITTHNTDYLKAISKIKQDVIYLDPQWNGPGYKLKEFVELKIGQIDLWKIVQQIIEHKLAKYIFIKAPFNVQLKNLKCSGLHTIFNRYKGKSFYVIYVCVDDYSSTS